MSASLSLRSPILRIALPAIVSNITVPLLGLVDTAIVGHLGAPACIGAIAVGGMLFNLLYWSFAFLRMGTSGLTAQACGQGNTTAQTRILLHALALGTAVAAVLIAACRPVADLAFRFITATPEVEQLARLYFRIGIWGAPAVLCLYGLTGWFIGMQNSRFPMVVAIGQNVVNILCSLAFVYGLNLGVEGVALGTVTAQYAGLLLAGACWLRGFSAGRRWPPLRELTARAPLVRFFRINSDIFLRTLCLVAVTTFFTAAGAAQGDVTLAANALLMQFFLLFSYVMDGFAYAGEALSGRFAGAGDRSGLLSAVRRLFGWGTALTAAFTLAYALGFDLFVSLLTDNPPVRTEAHRYYLWAVAIPAAGCAAFLFDGIFIGLTATRTMLLSMATASLTFFGLHAFLPDAWANHALWCAFVAYLAVRGGVEALCYPKILRRLAHRTDSFR